MTNYRSFSSICPCRIAQSLGLSPTNVLTQIWTVERHMLLLALLITEYRDRGASCHLGSKASRHTPVIIILRQQISMNQRLKSAARAVMIIKRHVCIRHSTCSKLNNLSIVLSLVNAIKANTHRSSMYLKEEYVYIYERKTALASNNLTPEEFE